MWNWFQVVATSHQGAVRSSYHDDANLIQHSTKSDHGHFFSTAK